MIMHGKLFKKNYHLQQLICVNMDKQKPWQILIADLSSTFQYNPNFELFMFIGTTSLSDFKKYNIEIHSINSIWYKNTYINKISLFYVLGYCFLYWPYVLFNFGTFLSVLLQKPWKLVSYNKTKSLTQPGIDTTGDPFMTLVEYGYFHSKFSQVQN